MKRKLLKILTASFIAVGALSNAQTIYRFDLSYNTANQTAGNWNNVPVNGSTSNFIDDQGTASSYMMATTSNFTSGNASGTSTPDASISSEFPGTATVDAWYVQDGATNTGTITFSNLNTANYYSFTIFASRASVTENRETLYTVVGSTTGTDTLNPSSNIADLATIVDVQPNSSGVITLTVTKGAANANGSGFAYINAFKITESTTAMAVRDVNFSNEVDVYPNPASSYFQLALQKASKNVSLKIYNAEGRLVKSLTNLKIENGVVRVETSGMAKGNYFLQIEGEGKIANKKLIVK